MASRHEEKYIIDYRQYAMLLERARAVLTPDANGDRGSYLITSLYFDDPQNNALLEKLDGLPEHSKFRIRTYGCSDAVIRLERKDKHGILTHKLSAGLSRQDVGLLTGDQIRADSFNGPAYDLAVQMQSTGLKPVVAVRYHRDAFLYPGTDLRLTFDTDLEAIAPDPEALFNKSFSGFPVLGKNAVIMEIKYGEKLPAFVRKLTSVNCMQLSVSKYALCREQYF